MPLVVGIRWQSENGKKRGRTDVCDRTKGRPARKVAADDSLGVMQGCLSETNGDYEDEGITLAYGAADRNEME